MDFKNVVVIGSTGTGKSSLLNTLCGKQDKFIVSSSNESQTCETVQEVSNWRNSPNQYRFIDTPGLADTQGRDTKHIAQMVAVLKQLKSIDLFLIVLNGQQTRFDQNIQAMLLLFRDIFGDQFINNTAIILTHWEQSQRAKKERLKQNVCEVSKKNEVNFKLREMGLVIQNDIRCFFIDNKIHTMTDIEIKDYQAEKELEILEQELMDLEELAKNNRPFICRDINECMSLNDQLKKQIQNIQDDSLNKEQMHKIQIQQFQDKLEKQRLDSENKEKIFQEQLKQIQDQQFINQQEKIKIESELKSQQLIMQIIQEEKNKILEQSQIINANEINQDRNYRIQDSKNGNRGYEICKEVLYSNGLKGWIGYVQWKKKPHLITRNIFHNLKADIKIEGMDMHVVELPLNHNGYRYRYSYEECYSIIDPIIKAYLDQFV